jgi:hypothetical protein
MPGFDGCCLIMASEGTETGWGEWGQLVGGRRCRSRTQRGSCMEGSGRRSDRFGECSLRSSAPNCPKRGGDDDRFDDPSIRARDRRHACNHCRGFPTDDVHSWRLGKDASELARSRHRQPKLAVPSATSMCPAGGTGRQLWWNMWGPSVDRRSVHLMRPMQVSG